MPRIRIRPNPHLKQIVLEETNDGRDVVRYLKSVFMEVDDGVTLFGLRPKDYARSHKIAAARILARIGLEEGKRYLRRNYVHTPFRRIHPEEEDGPKRDMAASTAQLYRLVRAKTRNGADIMIHFVEIMKGYHPEYKPHLRMAAARELVRQIEFDYDEPAETPTASTEQTHPENPDQTVTPTSDSLSANQPNPENPVHPVNPASDHPNPTDNSHSDAALQAYREYIRQNCAPKAESIYSSIIRRAADRPDLDSACQEAERLIAEFNQYAAGRDPRHKPVAVPEDLLAKSLTQRMKAPHRYAFFPPTYYGLGDDDFYYCLCKNCPECEELGFFRKYLRELEEEDAYLYEDP